MGCLALGLKPGADGLVVSQGSNFVGWERGVPGLFGSWLATGRLKVYR